MINLIFTQNFIKTFKGKNNSDNNLTVSLQHTSHDKYLKLYEIKSDLVDPDVDVLSNTLDFTHEDENIFLGLEASVHESLMIIIMINMSIFFQI